MKLIAFSLLDTKTGIFNTPFFFPHTGAAVRAVIDLGADMSTTPGRHPADFSLCEVGTFDDQSGTFEPRTPLHLGTVLSLMPSRPQQASLFPNPEPVPVPGWSPDPDQVNGRA